MTEFECAWVRDRLPEFVRDALDVADGARVEQHLATCADCAAECELVSAIAVPVAVPAELEARVVAVARSTTRRGSGVRQYAIAASFALAMVTGSILWRKGVGPAGVVTSSDVGVEAVLAQPTGADPLLHESGLQSLSEDELRTLLEELES